MKSRFAFATSVLRGDKIETFLSRRYAALLEDPDCHKLDWFDVALRRLGGIAKAAKLIRVSASRLKYHRDRGWSSLTSDQMMKVAQASGVPMLGLMMQCNEEVAAQRQARRSSLR